MHFINSLHHLIEISLPLTRLIELHICVAYHNDDIYIYIYGVSETTPSSCELCM